MAYRNPKPISVRHDGGAFSGWHWENPQRPRLLFCHATGFNAGAYRQMLSYLADDFDIYAPDMRGHGRSTLPDAIHLHRGWEMYAADIGAFLDHIGGSEWILSGHSMGATACVMAARNRNDVTALRLIEPVVVPKMPFLFQKLIMNKIIKRTLPVARAAERRRSEWPGVDEVRRSYQDKALFRNFAPGVLDDYLEDGLVQRNGKVVLSCAPAWEAATFRGSVTPIWHAFRAMGDRGAIFHADDVSSTVFKKSIPLLQKLGIQTFKARDAGHLVALENLKVAADFIRKGSV